MSRHLAARVAVVTGAARGIGAAIARRLASEGADLALLDRTEVAPTAVDELRGFGGGVATFEVDVTQRREVRGVVNDLRARFARVDVVVNDAAIAPAASIEATTESVFNDVMTINAFAPVLMVQELLDLIPRGGSVVNLASVAAFVANGSQVAYSASKGAVVAATRNLAFELAPRGIRVNAVAPGPTDTPALATVNEEARAARLDRIPLGRFGRPEEIAAVVAFLASNDASYVTGTVIVADGGFSIAGVR